MVFLSRLSKVSPSQLSARASISRTCANVSYLFESIDRGNPSPLGDSVAKAGRQPWQHSALSPTPVVAPPLLGEKADVVQW